MPWTFVPPSLTGCFSFNSNFLFVGKVARAWCCLRILNLIGNRADRTELRNSNIKRRKAIKLAVLKPTLKFLEGQGL
jgi:hypothetical protein